MLVTWEFGFGPRGTFRGIVGQVQLSHVLQKIIFYLPFLLDFLDAWALGDWRWSVPLLVEGKTIKLDEFVGIHGAVGFDVQQVRSR